MRVDYDDVVFEDDLRVTHEGKAFTGEVVEHAPNGTVITLTTYFEGFEDGPTAEWYPTGEPRSEGLVRAGTAVGVHQAWHRNGTIAAYDEFDDRGKLRLRRRWDEAGTLLEDRAFPA